MNVSKYSLNGKYLTLLNLNLFQRLDRLKSPGTTPEYSFDPRCVKKNQHEGVNLNFLGNRLALGEKEEID